MNLDLLEFIIPLLVTVILAVSGWVIGHRLNANRDLMNKRIELRTKYLLEAYRRLEKSVERAVDRPTLDSLESAIADIQLLGSPEQINELIQWFTQFEGKSSLTNVNLGKLLEDLRASLRAELGLKKTSHKIRNFRFSLSSELENIEKIQSDD